MASCQSLRRGLPLQPAGDHQVHHEPVTAAEFEGEALANALKRGHLLAHNRGQRGLDGAQEKGVAYACGI